MAMEKSYAVKETHTRSITALGYNPARREILMGCEDGCIKTWESESGKLVSTANEHKGWITDFLYWAEAKLMLSSANDRNIIAWASGGGVYDRISIGVPVYCMAINARRYQLVCGCNGGIRVYALDENKESGSVVNNRILYLAKEHTDIVRCVICTDTRTYSAGYDQKVIIYDSSFTGDNSLAVINEIEQAHDAGISCLVLARDNENNFWILTGSFDKTVKIWTADGKPIHKLDNFISTVSGICYVPRSKTVWVAGGTSYASLFDPKSGDNVSDFIGTFQQQEEEKYHLQILKFFPELNQVVASTSRRHLIVWKYNPSGCVTALKCRTAYESLCYTYKVPILIFSGDHEGAITKWERMQSNHFMYSKEIFQVSDSKIKKKRRTGSKARELMLEQEMQLKASQAQSRGEEIIKANKAIQSHYAFNKPIIPPVSTHNHQHKTIMKIVFVESLDIIVAASEDSHIYIWGFDDQAVSVLQSMKPQDLETLVTKYSILLDSSSELLPQNTKEGESDSVTNRVAGFICKYVFSEHESCVTSLVVMGRNDDLDSTYVLSAGWDGRICIWDLENGRLHDIFRNTSPTGNNDNLELACDGVILDMDYNPTDKEFAYSSSDKMVYIRKFSTNGSKMTLVNTLQGHEAEVTCVKWNTITKKWVTGSEDATIRIWSGSGLNECEQVLAVQGGVCCLCIDNVNGAYVAGIQQFIRVYEPEFYRLMQTNEGHTDAIRTVIHIRERAQYVSCSWDKTIRVWNAWKKQTKKKEFEEKGEGKSDKMKKVEISMEGEEGDWEEEGEREEEETGEQEGSSKQEGETSK